MEKEEQECWAELNKILDRLIGHVWVMRINLVLTWAAIAYLTIKG